MNPQGKGSFAPSSVWRLIIVILRIFCLALLIAVGFLSVKVFQVSDPPCGQLENLTKEMEIIQGEIANLPSVLNRNDIDKFPSKYKCFLSVHYLLTEIISN
ncbi:unnamed protein product [Eretmochelys imbricata]